MKKLIATLFGVLCAITSTAHSAPLSMAGTVIAAPAQNSDGSLQRLDFANASDYCNSIGMRVPTAREWAQYAIGHGANGISVSELPGYDPVYYNANQILFYFNTSGYQSEQFGIFWTSEPLWGVAMGVSFNSTNAHFWSWTNLTARLAVRCISTAAL